VEYMGDATITTDCPGVTWTSSQPLGGVGANEVVFTPSAPIVIPQSCAPSQASPPPACGGCKLEFGLRVVHQEPAGSDATPQIVEEAAGYIQGQGDAVCNEGLTGSLQSGSTQTANMPICPSCTIDQCNLGCDEQVTGMCQAQTASTPCADTDGNSCTTAGCELSPSDSTVGVCVQTHLLASNNTPCGTDEDTTDCLLPACVSGVCEQKTIPDTNKVNMPCTSTPDTPNNCLVPCCDGTGVCAESSSAAQANPTGCAVPDSTPCTDSDGNACTTAGCNGQGTCDQSHTVNTGSTTCASPVVGAAGDCTVLELDGSKVDVTGPPGGLVGDVCIGPNGKLSITGGEFVTGEVRLAAGATFAKSGPGTVGSVETNQDLSAEINAAIAASADAASRPCTITLSSISNATTINATGGGAAPTVVCVGDVVLNGRTVTLSGVSGDSFIINVTGKFVLNGGSRIVVSGIQPKDVLYNILGSGQQVAFTGGGGGSGCCKSSVDGTLIALHRNIALSPGVVNGELIGGQNISIVSGASVKCPPSPCVPRP